MGKQTKENQGIEQIYPVVQEESTYQPDVHQQELSQQEPSSDDMVRFELRRRYADSDTLNFSLVIRHRLTRYSLTVGYEYTYPRYVVDFIRSKKRFRYISNAQTGEQRQVEEPLYECIELD